VVEVEVVVVVVVVVVDAKVIGGSEKNSWRLRYEVGTAWRGTGAGRNGHGVGLGMASQL
jgi:hypothetical protein